MALSSVGGAQTTKDLEGYCKERRVLRSQWAEVVTGWAGTALDGESRGFLGRWPLSRDVRDRNTPAVRNGGGALQAGERQYKGPGVRYTDRHLSPSEGLPSQQLFPTWQGQNSAQPCPQTLHMAPGKSTGKKHLTLSVE